MHCSIFSIIPRSTHKIAPPAVTIKKVSRCCQKSPGGRKWNKITPIGKIFTSMCYFLLDFIYSQLSIIAYDSVALYPGFFSCFFNVTVPRCQLHMVTHFLISIPLLYLLDLFILYISIREENLGFSSNIFFSDQSITCSLCVIMLFLNLHKPGLRLNRNFSTYL